jgi:hypothetical protein
MNLPRKSSFLFTSTHYPKTRKRLDYTTIFLSKHLSETDYAQIAPIDLLPRGIQKSAYIHTIPSTTTSYTIMILISCVYFPSNLEWCDDVQKFRSIWMKWLKRSVLRLVYFPCDLEWYHDVQKFPSMSMKWLKRTLMTIVCFPCDPE